MTEISALLKLGSIDDLRDHYDLVIIGAGPAGMRAAITASRHGLSVLVVDRGLDAGGQIYRNVANASQTRKTLLGRDYQKGAELVAAFYQASCDYLSEATVWYLDQKPQIGISATGRSIVITARHVLLATGAMERPVTMPGWTLPGVMSVGAAQIMLKADGIIADGRVILAGSGPLLWLVASQYVKAGQPPLLVLDTMRTQDVLRALPALPSFLFSGLASKAADLITTVRRATTVHSAVRLTEITGADGVRNLHYQKGKRHFTVPFDHLFLHQGVIPETNLARAAGVAFKWNTRRAAFEAQRDAWGQTVIATISLAGDGAAIAGADHAVHDGAMAALEICRLLGRINSAQRDQYADEHRRGQAKALRGRNFLEKLYDAQISDIPTSGDAILCRCEEVTVGQLRHAMMQLPLEGPNQWKAFSRCGMGACQGRQCGLAVSRIMADQLKKTMDSIGYYRLRPPVFPVSFAELSTLEHRKTAEVQDKHSQP